MLRDLSHSVFTWEIWVVHYCVTTLNGSEGNYFFSGMCWRGQSVFFGAKKRISRTSQYEERRGEEVSKKPFFFNKRDIVNL